MIVIYFGILFLYFPVKAEENSQKLQDKPFTDRDSKWTPVECKSKHALSKLISGSKFNL